MAAIMLRRSSSSSSRWNSTRTVRFFPLYHPTARVEENLAALGALYDARMAYRPEQY